MRATLTLDDALVERARRLTGIDETTALVEAIITADNSVIARIEREDLEFLLS